MNSVKKCDKETKEVKEIKEFKDAPPKLPKFPKLPKLPNFPKLLNSRIKKFSPTIAQTKKNSYLCANL